MFKLKLQVLLIGIAGLVTSQSWEVMPHRGQQRQRQGRTLGLVLGLTRPGGKVLGLSRPGGQVGLARQGRSPPFERTHRRGITPTGDPADRRTGAASKHRNGKSKSQKRNNRNRNGRARQKKGRKSKSLEQREREVSKQDWHFAGRGRGATAPRNRWTGIGATGPKNREPVLDATSLFEENLKKPTTTTRAREGKQGSLEDSFVIGPDNQVLDARELFDDFGDNDIDQIEGFKATDGDIGVVDVSLSLETERGGAGVDLDKADGGIEVVDVKISTENSTKNLQPLDDPFKDEKTGREGSDTRENKKGGKKSSKDDIKKYDQKDSKKKPVEKKRGGKEKFPNNIRDVLTDFAFPSRFDTEDFPPKQLSVPRVDDKISQFTEDPTSTTVSPELTSTTDFVSTTNTPTTLDTFSTTDFPTTTTLQAEDEVETTTTLTTLVPDVESDVRSVTTDLQSTTTGTTTDAQISTTGQTSTDSIDSTTRGGIVVTESNQLGLGDISEITTNSAEEDESFTEDFEDIIFDDIENEISDDPLDTGEIQASLTAFYWDHSRSAEGGASTRG